MRKLAVPLALTAILAVAMHLQSKVPEVTVCDPPRAKLRGIRGMAHEDIPPSEAELQPGFWGELEFQ